MCPKPPSLLALALAACFPMLGIAVCAFGNADLSFKCLCVKVSAQSMCSGA